jgi:hypothetical protein
MIPSARWSPLRREATIAARNRLGDGHPVAAPDAAGEARRVAPQFYRCGFGGACAAAIIALVSFAAASPAWEAPSPWII